MTVLIDRNFQFECHPAILTTVQLHCCWDTIESENVERYSKIHSRLHKDISFVLYSCRNHEAQVVTLQRITLTCGRDNRDLLNESGPQGPATPTRKGKPL